MTNHGITKHAATCRPLHYAGDEQEIDTLGPFRVVDLKDGPIPQMVGGSKEISLVVVWLNTSFLGSYKVAKKQTNGGNPFFKPRI